MEQIAKKILKEFRKNQNDYNQPITDFQAEQLIILGIREHSKEMFSETELEGFLITLSGMEMSEKAIKEYIADFKLNRRRRTVN